MKRLGALLLTTALLAASCGDTADPTTTTSAPGTTAPTTTTAEPTTTTTSTTSTTSTTTTSLLPGEPIDFGPAAGDKIAVVGVRYDDALNLRAAPGADQAILTGLAPTYVNMIAQGNSWMLPSSFWYEVDADGIVGWVSARFIAYLGATDDYTSRIVADVGAIPSAETMLDLADIVADSLKSQGEPKSRITVAVAPVVGDVGEVTIDIIGFGDDALFGLRVVIFGQPDASGDSFSLMAAEAMALCGRGVTDDGLCV